jgi:hypothetical protein
MLSPTTTAAATNPTFTGTCTMSGTETFTPPLTLAVRTGSARVLGTARCSGTLVDTAGTAHTVRNAAASYRQVTTAGSISCGGGLGRGAGILTISGTALAFTVSEPQLTVVSTLTYAAPAWKGFGIASVAPTINPLRLALACLGAGISEVPIVLITRTQAVQVPAAFPAV